jgi:hypothetical protein
MVALFLGGLYFFVMGLGGLLAPEAPTREQVHSSFFFVTNTPSCAENAQEKAQIEEWKSLLKKSQYCVPQYLDCVLEEQGSCSANMHLCLLPSEEIDISAESSLLPLKEENLAKIPECDTKSRKAYSEALKYKNHLEKQKECIIEHLKCLKNDKTECSGMLTRCVSRVAKEHPFRLPAGEVMSKNEN